MRILIEGDNLEHYLAKCHEAFRTGLRAMFDTRCFGKGYPGYYPFGPFVRNYTQIANRIFPGTHPDVVFTWFNYKPNVQHFNYDGLGDVDACKCTVLADYWDVVDNFPDRFLKIMQDCGIDLIMSYFAQPLDIWADSPISDHLFYVPPSFNPLIFNDWQMPKIYDVGFLAANTLEYSDFYPERYAIHQKLLSKNGLRYLWAPHPGWKQRRGGHRLVGQGFSRAINSCKIFVTTGGKLRNAHAKYVEILASRSLLMADEPIGWERLGLKDGVNYVKICEDNVLDMVDYYLARPDLCDKIAERGYMTALSHHTCYTRALEFRDTVVSLRRI